MDSDKPVALIHTVAGLAPIFNGLLREVLPDTRVVHLVDEALLQDTIRSGEITNPTRTRLASYFRFAEQAGAAAVMVTCSSVGPAVDELAAASALPVLRVDTAMADEAVRLGSRIGVIGTLATTLEPTAALVRARAAQTSRAVTVEAVVCDGAFAALQAGNGAEHDQRVLAALRDLLARSDVIVLAQASMARVAEQLAPEDQRAPILTSPRLGVERLKRVVEGRSE